MKNLGFCCAVLALIGCAKKPEVEAVRPPAGEVWLSRKQIESQQMRIDLIGEQEVAASLDAPGRIAFDDLRVAHVFAPVSGRISRIEAAPGQRVRKGQLIGYMGATGNATGPHLHWAVMRGFTSLNPYNYL